MDIVFLVNLVPPAGLNVSVGLSAATRVSLHSQAPLSPESKINCTHAVNKNKKYGERRGCRGGGGYKGGSKKWTGGGGCLGIKLHRET